MRNRPPRFFRRCETQSADGVYLDSSAIVKLVLEEEESVALAGYLIGYSGHFSCGLARTEVVRAVRRHGLATVQRAHARLERISLIVLDNRLLDAAADIEPAILRSLDAIHLAAALLIADSIDTFVTYDRRQADAASALGLAVASPRAE